MDKDTVVTLLKYKRWIDLATLQAIRAIYGTVHGEKRHLTIRLMNHIHVVDMIFRANLRGRPHGYTALNTPETPTVDELETAMTACTDEYIQYVSAMTPADFHERIAFKFVDGGDGYMTAMEMLNHMLFHGAYHRGAVGWMIGECGGV
ncbi:diguanylate cyclase, partial [Acinetobacter baumannii]|nr:diguanylate cyclase [Acinetobacter baumannii]